MTILASLDSPVSDDDVVHYVHAGLPDKYNQVCGYMHYQNTFPDFKTVRSLLTTEEMRLKSKSLASHVDSSSSPMVLLADSGTSRRPSNPQVKSWRPCFNFAKGSFRFGSECRYAHDATVKPHTSNSKQSHNYTDALLSKLLDKLGMHESGTKRDTNTPTVTTHVAYTTNVNPTPLHYPAQPLSPYVISQSAHYMTPPPGFTYSPAQQQLVYYQPAHPSHVQPATVAGSVQHAQPSAPPGFLTGPADNTRQATTLPQAFTAETLHDPTTGAWNMDTGASSHLNNSVTSLITIFNSCMYPSVLVSDGHSIPVTNSGHSLLPTTSRSLHLNNVLITPHIDFLTRRVLLRYDSTGDLYPVTAPSPILHAFLVSQHMWHPRLGHPGSEVLRRLVSSNFISCNKDKHPALCHACQLSKHCDHGGEFDNRALHKLFTDNGIQFRFSCAHTSQQNALPERFTLHVSSISPLPKSYRNAFNDLNWQNDIYKARLVANGSAQIEGVDVDETFSPVVKPAAIQTILSLAASRHWHVHQLDVKNAFLHGDLSEIVYMHQPPGFRDSVHLDYGTNTAYLLLYVDDIILIASSKTLLQQTKCAVEILERAGMVNCNSSRTPIDTESKLGDTGDIVSDSTLYRSLAGSLQYLTFTRPDISYAVQQVCLHMHDPQEPHLSALKRILRYVRGTLVYGLHLFSSSTTDLVAYTDADWAGCPTTRCSTSGYYVFLGNNLLSWSSKRHPTLSRSSAEAEYYGAANAVAETC
ncbi:ribonuclease H-like domain-containing protein [Tanacetum coccineum]